MPAMECVTLISRLSDMSDMSDTFITKEYKITKISEYSLRFQSQYIDIIGLILAICETIKFPT